MNADHLRYAAAVAGTNAAKARSLLENDVLIKAFADIESQYIMRWQNAQSTDQREDIFFRIQGLKALREDLAAVVSGGQVAAYNTRHLLK